MIITALVNGLWQGAPIFAIACILSLAVPKRNAATRYALWYATLLALAIVPVATAAPGAGARLFAALAPHPAAFAYKVSLIPVAPYVHSAGVWFDRWLPWLVALWLAGVVIGIARLSASFLRIERIRRNALPLPDAGAGVVVSDDVAVPIVAGILAPAIVVPTTLASTLSPADLRSIVAHERAHLRRNDALLNLVQRLIEVVLFFNPWIRLASNCVSEEREIACDDWVVERGASAYEYASCLAALAQRVRRGDAPLLTPSALRSRHALVSRIERLSSNEPRALTINYYALGGTIVLFIIATLLLQTVSPAFGIATPPSGLQGAPADSMLAASCSNPNSEASVRNAAAPQPPHGVKAAGSVEVTVTISPSGKVSATKVLRSSGNAALDQAVINAAKQSTYSPKIVNCMPVEGTYIFRADFAPSP
ncbi:MAG TPA: M56 family metallopeptidase [Candidatus Nitrosotalea sp.]|nr:M56 family metallopeptidase [Candidatus Nitrosotalea sp.]